MTVRCFLSQDNSCHWYLVPAGMREAWNEWCNLDEDDERAWDAPPYAVRLPGSPSQVEFEMTGEQIARLGGK